MRKMNDRVTVYRASKSALGLLIGALAVPLGLMLIVALRQPSFWLLAVMFAAATFFMAIWLGSFELQVSNDGLAYRSLFAGRKMLPLTEIDSAWIEIGVVQPGDRYRSPARVIVKGRNDSLIHINTKVFPRSALLNLHEFLTRNGKLR